MSFLKSHFYGLTDYRQSLVLQTEHHAEVLHGAAPQVLGFEHPLVITLGKRGNAKEDLTEKVHDWPNIDVVTVDRGGQATLHSPGQLVIYPIIPIDRMGLSVKEFIHIVEHTSIEVLKRLGVESFSGSPEPGIYTLRGKIGFLGFRIEQGVSRHGLAINLSNDLGLFSLIVSCGVKGAQFTRLSDFSVNTSTEDLFKAWVDELAHNLRLTPRPTSVNMATTF